MGIGVRQVEINHQFITNSVVELCVFRLVSQMGQQRVYSLIRLSFPDTFIGRLEHSLPYCLIPQKLFDSGKLTAWS